MMVQDPDNPALWLNDEWEAGTPGAFAVVIGVSHYPHLDGSRKSYYLSQLAVSALTAFRFFAWLHKSYLFTGRPVAKCWLLLSPSPEEQAFEEDEAFSSALSTVPAARLNECEQAIREWFAEMDALPKVAAEKSASFFFFSGHGLEITLEQQILLPSDYLRPPTPVPDDAISMHNLRNGLAPLFVRDQFFFLDSCRNDHAELRGADIRGRPILPVWPAAKANLDRQYPIMYASAAGSQAWAPADPKDGISLFGEAVLAGLIGTPNIALDKQSDRCFVRPRPLKNFTQEQVQALLRKRGRADIQQRIRLGGEHDEPPITELDTNVVSKLTEALQPPQPSQEDVPYERLFNHAIHVQGWDRVRPPWPPSATLEPSHVFGSEAMTDLWQDTRVFSLGSRRWLTRWEDYLIYSLRRDEARRVYTVEIAFADRGDHWLEFTQGDTRFATLLPDDPASPDQVRYRLDVRRTKEGDVASLAADLSRNNSRPLYLASTIWEHYSNDGAIEAANHHEMDELESMLRYKLASPLAALISGIVLLRARRLPPDSRWLRDLAKWFPGLPDGPVLWMEQSLRQGRRVRRQDVDLLLSLTKRGLPRTVEGLSFAWRQAQDLSVQGEDDIQLRDRHKGGLKQLEALLRQAVHFFRSDGLFTVLSGPKEDIVPELALMVPIANQLSNARQEVIDREEVELA